MQCKFSHGNSVYDQSKLKCSLNLQFEMRSMKFEGDGSLRFLPVATKSANATWHITNFDVLNHHIVINKPTKCQCWKIGIKSNERIYEVSQHNE